MMYETKDRAVELRKQGLTYTEIGKRLGVTRQRIAQCCAGMTKSCFYESAVADVKYSGLKRWMIENKVSPLELMKKMGIYNGNAPTNFKNRLSCKASRQLRMHEIVKILAVTGETFEQLFLNVEEEDIHNV